MKKVLVLVAMFIMVFSLAACAEDGEKEYYTKAEVEVMVGDLETDLEENQLVITELETQISTLEMNLRIIDSNQDVVVHNFDTEIARLEALIIELQPETE